MLKSMASGALIGAAIGALWIHGFKVGLDTKEYELEKKYKKILKEKNNNK